MFSIVLFVVIASMFLCVGFLIGSFYTVLFTAASAISATVALILAIRRYKSGKGK